MVEVGVIGEVRLEGTMAPFLGRHRSMPLSCNTLVSETEWHVLLHL